MEGLRHQLDRIEQTLQTEPRRSEEDRPNNREERQENQGIINLVMCIVEIHSAYHPEFKSSYVPLNFQSTHKSQKERLFLPE